MIIAKLPPGCTGKSSVRPYGRKYLRALAIVQKLNRPAVVSADSETRSV
jgi:hypothetical protein